MIIAILILMAAIADPNDVTPPYIVSVTVGPPRITVTVKEPLWEPPATTVSINVVPSLDEQVYDEVVEIKWLDEPNGIQSLMEEWYSEDPNIHGWYAEYSMVTIDNWLRPTRPALLTVDDQAEMRLPYCWFGDLNHDGCVRMDDFGIAAKYFKGRIKNPPEPEPMTEIESLAEIMKLFLQ